MNFILIATTLILCGLHTSEALGPDEMGDFYDMLDPAVWTQVLKLNATRGEGTGRAGLPVDLGDAFWDSKCKVGFNPKTFGDFCFIVQTSCLENEDRRTAVLKSVKNDIRDILSKIDHPTYSMVTYSKDAQNVLEWSSDAGKMEKALDIKNEGTCDDCKAATYKAIDACKKLFENKPEDRYPNNIIIFTNGISVDDLYNMIDARRKTISAALEIMKENLINLQVVKIPPANSPVEITGDDEWGLLTYIAQTEFAVDRVPCPGLGVNNDQTLEIPILSESPLNTEIEPCCTADVIFILDKSKSISRPNVQRILDFVDDFLEVQEKILEPSAHDKSEGLQIGIITYGGEVTVDSNLGERGKEDLRNLVNSMSTETTFFTSTHLALGTAYDQFKSSTRKDNEHVRKIVVLCTDGRTFKVGARKVDNGKDTIKAAKKLKDYGAEMYIVGLPNNSKNNDGYKREWVHMASEPKNCTIVNLQKQRGSFHDLSYVWKHLTEEICLNNKKETCRWDD